MLYLYFTKVLPEKYSAQDYRGIEVMGCTGTSSTSCGSSCSRSST